MKNLEIRKIRRESWLAVNGQMTVREFIKSFNKLIKLLSI